MKAWFSCCCFNIMACIVSCCFSCSSHLMSNSCWRSSLSVLAFLHKKSTSSCVHLLQPKVVGWSSSVVPLDNFRFFVSLILSMAFFLMSSVYLIDGCHLVWWYPLSQSTLRSELPSYQIFNDDTTSHLLLSDLWAKFSSKQYPALSNTSLVFDAKLWRIYLIKRLSYRIPYISPADPSFLIEKYTTDNHFPEHQHIVFIGPLHRRST